LLTTPRNGRWSPRRGSGAIPTALNWSHRRSGIWKKAECPLIAGLIFLMATGAAGTGAGQLNARRVAGRQADDLREVTGLRAVVAGAVITVPVLIGRPG
jgi:hypothetical protein